MYDLEKSKLAQHAMMLGLWKLKATAGVQNT
jgi:hypothetical protein